MTRVLVGNSVFENAQLVVNDGWLFIEFEDEDVDDVAVGLAAVNDAWKLAAWQGKEAA